jgi:hypothetical protein
MTKASGPPVAPVLADKLGPNKLGAVRQGGELTGHTVGDSGSGAPTDANATAGIRGGAATLCAAANQKPAPAIAIPAVMYGRTKVAIVGP